MLWIAARLSGPLREKVEAEDIAQEVLLAVHRDLDGYEDRGVRSFYSWFFRIAENRIRDQVDYHSAKKRQASPGIAVSPTTPGTAAIRGEQLERVRRAIERLSDDYRRVIQLRRLEERDVAEVAGMLDRTPNAVRVLYCRALKALRDELNANA